MTKLQAAVVQAGSLREGTAATVVRAQELILECGTRGVELAVFPEAFIGGYPKGANFDIVIGTRSTRSRSEFASYYARSIEVPGAETDAIGKAAAQAGVFVVIGIVERDGGTLYCTVLFFGNDGTLLGKHRKTMPTGAERLCWGFGDGSTLTAIATPWGKVGAVICWENYMPLLRMAMFSKQVAIYCAPTADDRDTWPGSMQHVALEGRCFVLSACQYLTRSQFPDDMTNLISNDDSFVLMRGGSLIVNPLGKILAGPAYNGESILQAELDLDEIICGKFDLDVAGHYARPDLFSLAVDESPRRAVHAAPSVSIERGIR